MNQRLMLSFLLATSAVSLCFLEVGAARADPVKPQQVGITTPEGAPPTRYRVTGARSSTTLSTLVHCTNLESVEVHIYAYFYQFDGSYVCSAGALVAAGGTRTLATRDTASFAEDDYCPAAPAPDVGQGSVNISVVPVGAKLVCSAEIVSVSGDPPTTLGALDIWPAN